MFENRDQNELNKLHAKITVNKLDQRALEDLTLSDRDYLQFEISKQFNNFRNKICNKVQPGLYSLKSLKDKFVKINDEYGNKYIMYNSNGELIIPLCYDVAEIEVEYLNQQCYEDVPVSFLNKNKSQLVTGFLTREKIIKKKSRIVDCNLIEELYPINI